MAEYKRKKFKNKPVKSTRKRVQVQTEEIEMKSGSRKSSAPQKKNVRVITGKKLIRRQRLRSGVLVCIVLALVIFLLEILLPVGIADSVTNLTAVFGTGSYPIELYGTQTLNSVSKGSYFFVLSDTEFKAVSSGGKQILSVSHGFASPILKHSATRALLLDQNGTRATVYNLGGEVSEISTEKNIITGAIARNGTYCIVTESDDYTAVVSVYSKDDSLIYEWYSASDHVNNVAISPNGKRLAVSTVNASNGYLNSKVFVLEYESADAVYTTEYPESTVYSIESFSAGFAVATNNSFSFISWKDFSKTDYNSDSSLAFMRCSSSGVLLAFNRESNRADNHIVVFSSKGKQLVEFDFNGLISDIVMSRNHIYCISDTTVSLFDKEGTLLCETQCDYGVERLAVLSAYETALISNSEITRIEISKEE